MVVKQVAKVRKLAERSSSAKTNLETEKSWVRQRIGEIDEERRRN